MIAVNDGDLVFFQNGSMTDGFSLELMTSARPKLTKEGRQRRLGAV